MTVVFEQWLIATMEDTWHAPRGGGRSNWSLVGTEGAVAYDSLTGRLSLSGNLPPFNGGVHTARAATSAEGLDHLLAVVRGEQEPVATVEDAWRNLAACRAFYDAAGSGSVTAPAALTAAR